MATLKDARRAPAAAALALTNGLDTQIVGAARSASVGPLDPGIFIGREAMRYLDLAQQNGTLPGMSKDDVSEIVRVKTSFSQAGDSLSRPVAIVFEMRKSGDTSAYHYTVAFPSQGGEWKPQRAWRTDPDGRVVAEYPVQ